MAEPAPAVPDEKERQRLSQCARRWIQDLTASEKWQQSWQQDVKKIVQRYRYHDSKTVREHKFAMLWSNTQTILPAIYARPPQAVVTRRFNDSDPVARVASEVLERCLSFSIDKQDLDGVLRGIALDFCLGGRGISWERYSPTFGPEVVPEVTLQIATDGQEDDPQYTDDAGNVYAPKQALKRDDGTYYAEGEPYRPVEFEESITDYVHWQDFGHSIARTWDEVVNGGFVWRRAFMSRKALVERFGEDIGKRVPLDWGPREERGRFEEGLQKKAAIYEVWDASTKCVYWISKAFNERPLDERQDPLGLDGFFPCPRPILATTGNETCIPVPDFTFYQDQAREIDVLTARITQLQNALKVRGFYAGDAKNSINNLLNSDNNILIPIPDWQTLKDGGGLQAKIEWWPIDKVVQALQACVEQRQLLVQDVWQITGIADIMRGISDPNATATAERLKGHWGPLRVRTKQTEMQRFARDQLRIKGEVIAEKFDIETLRAMSGIKIPTAEEKAQAQAVYDQGAAQYQMAVQQAQASGAQPPPQPEVPPEIAEALRSPSWEDVVALLRDNAMRQFRIDIETDSTIEPDETEEKAQAVEFIAAVGSMIQQWGPAIQSAPQLAPMAAGFIKWGARRFRVGRELEDIIDTTMDQIAQTPPQQPQEGAAPPDRSVEVAQIKGQADIQKEQIKQQGEDGRAQLDAQIAAGDQALEGEALRLKLVVGGQDRDPQVNV